MYKEERVYDLQENNLLLVWGLQENRGESRNSYIFQSSLHKIEAHLKILPEIDNNLREYNIRKLALKGWNRGIPLENKKLSNQGRAGRYSHLHR